MLEQTLNGLADVGLWFLVFSVVAWGIFYKKFPLSIKYLGIYLFLNLVIQIVADQLFQKGLPNLPLLHLNTLLEFVFLSLFFKEVYKRQDSFKKYFIFFVLIVALLLILNSVFIEPIYGFNSKAKSLVQICIIFYVVLYFFDSYGKVDFLEGENLSINMICFAVLLYYAGSLFIFMFSQFFFVERSEAFYAFWVVNAGLTFIFQLIMLISITLLIMRKRTLIGINK